MKVDQPIPLPPTELRFMSEDDEGVLRVGKGLADTLRRHGLTDDGLLLDVGSGYGRLAIGLMATGYGGEYLGIEILKKQERWCRTEFQPYAGDHYAFKHLDVRNGRYNPNGRVLPHEVRFPTPDASCSYVALFSVFTHMYEADIRRYLRQIHRVLRPGGTALTTWFLFNRDRLAQATDPSCTRFPMTNRINAVTRYHEPTDPLRAISYREKCVRRMIEKAGLTLTTLEYGSWCGDKGVDFQDVVVLTKSSSGP